MQPRRIHYTEQADIEIDDILDFIEARSGDIRAINYVAAMRACFQGYAGIGFTGHPADGYFPGCHRYVFRQHIAILRITADVIEVLHVFHAACNIAAIVEDDA